MNRLLKCVVAWAPFWMRHDRYGRSFGDLPIPTKWDAMSCRHFLIVLLVLCSHLPLRAAVVERDWKTDGDGLLTYDTVNRREWLDLSQSRLDQFPEPRLENALAEIGPGGMFEGFTFAELADVIALAQSAGINTAHRNFAINEQGTANLIELLSITLQSSLSVSSIGFINEPSGTPHTEARFYVDDFSAWGEDATAGLYFYPGSDFLVPSVGLMLYRPVPEPSSALLSVFAVFLWVCGIRIFRNIRSH
jgi:hypothetical protein